MDHNTYKEYKEWLKDNKEFIEALEEKAPELSEEFELEFYVLDVLYELAENDDQKAILQKIDKKYSVNSSN